MIIFRRLMLGSVLLAALSVQFPAPASAEVGWWYWLLSPTQPTTTPHVPRSPASTVSAAPRVTSIQPVVVRATPRYAQAPILLVGVGF